MTDEMRFDDDVVIVTGAGRGLGRDHALLFASRGARVVVNDLADRDNTVSAAADAVVGEIRSAGGQAIADAHSVADPAGARAVVQTALEAFGEVTILVNNAGIIDFAAFGDLTVERWEAMMRVTLDGAFHMTQAVWPHFVARHYGRVVNTTSNAGFAGSEQIVHYGAAKLGVAGLTKALAQEGIAHGILVNAVAPMAVTLMNRDAFFGGAEGGADWQADIRDGIAPIGPPAAVSPTVLWLAHRSTMINGEIYSSSSGKVARVAFVVGEGWFKPEHTPEDLRDNAARIRTLGAYADPANVLDEIALIPPLFGRH